MVPWYFPKPLALITYFQKIMCIFIECWSIESSFAIHYTLFIYFYGVVPLKRVTGFYSKYNFYLWNPFFIIYLHTLYIDMVHPSRTFSHHIRTFFLMMVEVIRHLVTSKEILKVCILRDQVMWGNQYMFSWEGVINIKLMLWNSSIFQYG